MPAMGSIAGSGLFRGVAAGHMPALVALLVTPLAAWLLLSLARLAAATGSGLAGSLVAGHARSTGPARAAALLMLATGLAHLALVPGHAHESPMLARLFLLNGLSFIGLTAAAFTKRWWRPASALLLLATIFAYLATIGGHHEAPDQAGIILNLVELTAFGFVLFPRRSPERSRRSVAVRPLRWGAVIVAVPIATVLTGAVIWAVLLAPSGAEAAGGHRDLAASTGHHEHAQAGMIMQPVPAGPPTAAQQEAAAKLVADTRTGIDRYQDVSVAAVDGYVPSTAPGAPTVHYMNWAYMHDGKVLDPERPESLVYATTPHGMVLLGAMYVMPKAGMKGPDVGGSLTPWHEHDNVCFALPSKMLVGLTSPFGACPTGSLNVHTSAMLHVWTAGNPSGPFGDLDPAYVARLTGRAAKQPR